MLRSPIFRIAQNFFCNGSKFRCHSAMVISPEAIHAVVAALQGWSQR